MMNPTTLRIAASVALLLCLPLALAGPPHGYYETVDAGNSATLRTTLHAVIDDHILDVYKNAGYHKISGGVGQYNREHT